MVSDLKTLAHKGCKITAQKSMFLLANFADFGIGATIRIGQVRPITNYFVIF